MTPTKGLAIARHNKVVLYKGAENIDEVIYDCANYSFTIEEQHSNSRLAMQAFNMYNEAGLTPNQCYLKLQELRRLLNKIKNHPSCNGVIFEFIENQL